MNPTGQIVSARLPKFLTSAVKRFSHRHNVAGDEPHAEITPAGEHRPRKSAATPGRNQFAMLATQPLTAQWSLMAMAICILSIVLTLPLGIGQSFCPFEGSQPLQSSAEVENKGNLLVKTHPVPATLPFKGPAVLLVGVPLGTELRALEFLDRKGAPLPESPGSDLSRLEQRGFYRAINLPAASTEVRLTLVDDLLTPVTLNLTSFSRYSRAVTDSRTLTVSLVSAQLFLALFAFGVAYFSRLRVIEWFGWWLVALASVTLVISGDLSSIAPAKAANWIENHLMGAVMAAFGLASLRLRLEIDGRAGPQNVVQTRNWMYVWLGLLGLVSLAYPHPFILGLLLVTAAAYCLKSAVSVFTSGALARTPWLALLGIAVWLVAGYSIMAEFLPWFGGRGTRSGIATLFPTLYSAAFTAFTLSRAIRLERTIRRDAQKRAESSLRQVAEVLENTPIAMLSANYRGRLVSANLQARELWPRLDWSQPQKHRLDDLVGDQYAGLLADAFKTKGSVEAILNLAKGDQRPKDLICQLKLFRTANSLELTLIDITDQERMTRVLENQVSTDPLTRLLNRRGLDQHLRALQTLVNRNEAQASLLFIDLDRFKIVNDLYGHDYGDELLVQIALRAKAMGENRLTIARIGGDEFVVLVPNASLDTACDLAEELRAVISNRPYPVKDKLLTVGASIGVVRLIKGMEPKDALTYADRACGHAKKSGRGRVERIEASDKLLIELKTESHLQELMTARLPTERLRIYAQPLVPLNGRAGLAYEILVRYVDEENRILPPGQLISIAERQGMMSQLDKWVLESTLQFLDTNQRFSRNSLFFTVNLSGSSINDRRFLSDILKLFERYAHLADRVILEITETVALLDTKYTRRFMDAMIAKGVRFALDDFGAGYTSFGYLKDLPANMLKIDGNFIASLGDDTSCQRIVRTMSTLSQQLGMQSVAEWVEDTRTLELLISMQIDFAQGFYFSPAKPIEFWVQGDKVIASIQAKAQQFTRPAPSPAPKGETEQVLSALV